MRSSTRTGSLSAFPRLVIVSAALLLLGGCVRWPSERPPEAPADLPLQIERRDALRSVKLKDLPLLIDDFHATEGGWSSFETALERHRDWLRRQPEDRVLMHGGRPVTVGLMLQSVDRLLGWLDQDPTPQRLASWITGSFDVMESVGDRKRRPDGDVLVTGYYVPMIEGSLRPSPDYPVPIYGPARGLIRVDLGSFDESLKGKRIAGLLEKGRLVPFPDRKGIRESGVMRGREIAWAKDPVDLFFVEIQGSGTLRLPDGSTQRFGYAGANGRSYRSVGRLLIDEGKVPREKMSMQAIRAYLAENPDDLHRVLDHNTSQVFFRLLDGPAVGNLGVPVTPGRSVAVDQKLLPRGGIGFLMTDLPAPGPDGSTVIEGKISRFVIAQDTGGAIRGPDRVDFFWGPGEDAAARAGVMKQQGRIFFFVPKETPKAKDLEES